MSEWTTGTPESAGFDSAYLPGIARALRAGALRNVHGVVVVRHGRLVSEAYFDGRDEYWGRPLGQVRFGPDTVHDLRSITKSIVGLLYGIADGEGRVAALDRPLLDGFPERNDERQMPPSRRSSRVASAVP